MKRLIPAVGLLVALAGCADGYIVGGGGMRYYGYYDDFYGPFYDGYWGDDGVFFYRTDRHGTYVRDGAHHFRHDAPGVGIPAPTGAGRFHPVQGRTHGGNSPDRHSREQGRRN